MTTYLVFAWPDYEASGGANDCFGVFDTPRKALAVAQKLSERGDEQRENVQIVRVDQHALTPVWAWTRYGHDGKPCADEMNAAFEAQCEA